MLSIGWLITSTNPIIPPSGGGALYNTEYDQRNDEQKRIREKINRDDNEFMFLAKILIEQCQ